jgi:hypothetical protein
MQPEGDKNPAMRALMARTSAAANFMQLPDIAPEEAPPQPPHAHAEQRPDRPRRRHPSAFNSMYTKPRRCG